LYKQFAKKNPKKGMFYNEFSKGYRASEPGVTDEEIKEAWNHGNKNNNKVLEPKEFMRLYETGMKEAEARKYWEMYTTAGADYMTRRQFTDGYKSQDPNATTKMIRDAWSLAAGRNSKTMSFE